MPSQPWSRLPCSTVCHYAYFAKNSATCALSLAVGPEIQRSVTPNRLWTTSRVGSNSDSSRWTKPLRGRNQVDVQFVSTGDPSGFQSTSCSLDKPLCRTMELLLAANPSDKGAFHDFSSPSHARRHADPQLGGEHPGVLRPADLTLRTLLSSVTRAVGTGADSCLPGLPDEGKEVGYRFDRHRHFRTSLPV